MERTIDVKLGHLGLTDIVNIGCHRCERCSFAKFEGAVEEIGSPEKLRKIFLKISEFARWRVGEKQ